MNNYLKNWLKENGSGVAKNGVMFTVRTTEDGRENLEKLIEGLFDKEEN